MLKEELIKYETAKLAHEKGFDGMCIHQYCMDQEGEPYLYETPYYLSTIGNECNGFVSREDLIEDSDILAPSQSLLNMWLRQVHNKNVVIDQYNNVSIVTDGCNGSLVYNLEINCTTYEQALEKGLQSALNLV